MAKLFPKLVSSLALLLLLCQFGYVACQPPVNSPSRNATLPADEEKALEDLLIKLEWGFHPNISRSACSSNFEYIKCDCTDENSTVCHVTGLDLGFNELTGQLPPQLGELKYLNHLDVGSNNLSGELPGNYANFSTWDQLRVAGNRLTGQVPKFIANWNGLSYLVIRNCSISGEIPPYIGDWSRLKYLSLAYNMLSGQIPKELGDLSNLKMIDLSFNNLSGGIPDSMKNLNLTKMFLTGNMLSGTVPPWLPRKIKDTADLSYNNFDDGQKGEGKLNM
ncbi:hypothetical protein D5086_028695 [Populus alba]|uniref:Uncharacterized protein n=1 Tax=Populus alba TaxID=43335 RepID=A0ACC4ARJ2_POPAL